MKKIVEKIKKIFSYYIVKVLLIAFVLTIFCDICNQRSFSIAFLRLFTKPLTFIFNMLIIFIPLSLSGLFKHRKFALIIFSAPWLVLAIATFIVQGYKEAPISYFELSIAMSVRSVFNTYLSIFEMILIFTAIAAAIAGLVLLYKKEHKKERVLKHSIIASVAALLFVLSIRLPLISVGALDDDYDNIAIAYREYGMPYCFVVSLVDRNVDKPEEYNKEIVEESLIELEKLMNQLDKQAGSTITVNNVQKPNVIFLQLESFIDPNHILNLDFSENPVPYFTYLKENYPTGSLTVPTLGAGTSNVEFEIMTGLNLDYFAAGQYPYTTVMTEQTVESIAYNLKNYGYYSTVIHNNKATFYKRNEVFKNMGYDRFISSEFMINLEYTQVGWTKDGILTYEIMKALKNTEESDFIYTISVQPHGKYLENMEEIENILINCNFNDGSVNDKLLAQYTYYVNQIYEEDLFIKDLIQELENYNEPTMVVLYGDHLPNLDLQQDNLYLKDKYKTEYVIWSNFETNIENKDLSTFELSSHILENIECKNGIINKLHQTKSINNKYWEMYHLFEYDIFSDNNYLWNGKNPYVAGEAKLGYDDISIKSVKYENGALIIQGENFNESSIVYLNGNKKDTIYIDDKTLMVNIKKLDEQSKICVKQVYDNTHIFFTTEIYEYNQN